MFNLKEKLEKMVFQAIDSYDFEDAIEDAISSIDLEEIIFEKLHSAIRDIDIECAVSARIDSYLDDIIKESEDYIIDSLIDNIE